MSTTRPARTGTSGLRHLALAGSASAAVVVWSAGAVGPPAFARPFTSWSGLLSPVGVWPDFDRWPGLVLATSLLAFVGVWLRTTVVARREAWSTREVWLAGAAWALPLVAGPPILSNDVFSYVAQGAVAATGLDPTRVSPGALGWRSPLFQAVDPRWRDTPSPYGPLATLVQREFVEAAGGHPVLAVVALRLVALLGVVGIAGLVVSLARAHGRSGAEPGLLLLTWANPLLLLHVVAAVHLEGLLVLLVLVAVRAATARTATGDLVAALAAGAAAAVKLPVGGVTAVVLAVAVAARGTTPATRLGRAASVAGVTVAAYGILCVLAGSGWRVLAVLAAPAAGRTPAAPATLLATGLTPLRWLGVTDQATLETLGRGLVAVVAVAVIGGLTVTAGRRPVACTAGLALLALAAGSPVLYPWYLVWSVPLLAVGASAAWARRLTVLSAVGAVMTVQGLTHLETWVLASAVVTATLVALVVTEPGWRRRVVAGATRSATGLRRVVAGRVVATTPAPPP